MDFLSILGYTFLLKLKSAFVREPLNIKEPRMRAFYFQVSKEEFMRIGPVTRLKPTRTELGRLIRERRLSLKLTLREAGVRAKVSIATFSRLERGEYFSRWAIERVCEALELRVAPELLDSNEIRHDGQSLSFTLPEEEFVRHLSDFVDPVRYLQTKTDSPITKLVLEVLLIMMQQKHESYSFVLEKHHGMVELELFRVVGEQTPRPQE